MKLITIAGALLPLAALALGESRPLRRKLAATIVSSLPEPGAVIAGTVADLEVVFEQSGVASIESISFQVKPPRGNPFDFIDADLAEDMDEGGLKYTATAQVDTTSYSRHEGGMDEPYFAYGEYKWRVRVTFDDLSQETFEWSKLVFQEEEGGQSAEVLDVYITPEEIESTADVDEPKEKVLSKRIGDLEKELANTNQKLEKLSRQFEVLASDSYASTGSTKEEGETKEKPKKTGSTKEEGETKEKPKKVGGKD